MSSSEKKVSDSRFGGEMVLVVPDAVLNQLLGKGKDFHRVESESLENIKTEIKFIERAIAEQDETWRQLIPYVLIGNSDDSTEFFLFKRLSTQGEKRLHNMYSLGAGGHINPVDEHSEDILTAGLIRELSEELYLPEDLNLTFQGWIYSDIDNVSRVHAGMVFMLPVRKGEVRIREVDKMTGQWCFVNDLSEYEDGMEGWAKIVYRNLLKMNWE